MAAPAIDYQKGIFTFTDGMENTSAISHYVYQGLLGAFYGDLDPLYEAMQAASDAALEKLTLTFTGADPTESGAEGVYDIIEDKATLLFQASDNSTVKYDIPAPKAGFFAADEKTINPAAGFVATLITEILLIIVTRGQARLVEYIRGWRATSKARKTKPGVVLKVP